MKLQSGLRKEGTPPEEAPSTSVNRTLDTRRNVSPFWTSRKKYIVLEKYLIDLRLL
jgi:hypothetical protein